VKVLLTLALTCLEHLPVEIAQDHPLKAASMHQKTEKATAISTVAVADTALQPGSVDGPDSPDCLIASDPRGF
jgi:hypothetical protein